MGWLALAGLIVAVLALRRVNKLVERVAVLESAVRRSEERVPQPDGARPAPTAATAPNATWVQEPIDVDPQHARRAAPPFSDSTAPPPPAPPVSTSQPTPPPPSRPRISALAIDWERWVGVRGAALLGSVVLALAGLYFFQYSIEHGLIPPWLRVTIGTLLGIACILGSEWKARERYATTANALIGAGVAILYSAVWAARVLYELIGLELAFASMIAVTAACTALSYRHASVVIALIGLVGGFATPLVLSTGTPRPIGLFAYLLMLDACLLFIANRRGWPLLAVLSLVGTLGYQVLWVLGGMSPDQLLLTLSILAAFAVLYAAATRQLPAQSRRQWLVTQGGGLLFPFAFAVYFAASAEFGSHFYPVGALLILLAASASWLAVMQDRGWLSLGAASGSVAVFACWTVRTRFDEPLVWEASLSALLLAGVFHAFSEWKRQRADRSGGPATTAIFVAIALIAVLVVASTRSALALWPWLAGWLGLAALLLRDAGMPGRRSMGVVAPLGVALALWIFYTAHADARIFPPLDLYVGVLGMIAIAVQTLALMRPDPGVRRSAEIGATAAAIAMILSLGRGPILDTSPELGLGAALLLGVLALLPATRLGSGGWVFAAMASTALVHTAWTDHSRLLAGSEGLRAYALQVVAVLVFSAWPFVALGNLRQARFAWYAVALAGPAWFASLRAIHTEHFGTAAIGLLPIGLGALSLLAARGVTRVWSPEDSDRKSKLAWLLAVALGFATVAIPLQLEKEWITLGWALEAAAVAALWRRLDHPGLKYFALALIVGATLRLVANEAVLGYYPRPSMRIVNWLLYTYWVSAAALLGTALLLRSEEVTRATATEWEAPLYRFGKPLVAGAAGLATVAILFVWINLAIADWFATGNILVLSFQRLPARDLATSITWAVYALALLAVGVRGNSGALRWLSLGLLMVTVVKVFLYDLGELEDLYRVASLLGLAVSLILVSLAYQRFVVRGGPQEERQ